MKLVPISVLNVTNTDSIGGRFNGLSLSRYFPSIGVESELAVWEKQGSEPQTWQLFQRPIFFHLARFIRRIEDRFSLQSLLYFGSWRLLCDRRAKKADVFHLHLVHNHFFSIFSLPFLTWLKPTVWTVHDTWAFTGRCVQPFECEGWKSKCGVCPDVSTHFMTRVDRSRLHWWIKKFVYRFSRLELIVASQHMLRMVERSSLLGGFKTHLVPFGVDTSKFKPGTKAAARERFGVKPGSFVLSCRTNGGNYKGVEFIVAALRGMSPDVPICIITMEVRGMLAEFDSKFQVIEFDWLEDESLLVDIYNASDVFLMPSMAEAFGMMAVEAMACGTPVIVFEGTALPWVVDAPHVGISVPRANAVALRQAILTLVERPDELADRSAKARALALERYSLEAQARTLRAIYEGALLRFRHRSISPSNSTF